MGWLILRFTVFNKSIECSWSSGNMAVWRHERCPGQYRCFTCHTWRGFSQFISHGPGEVHPGQHGWAVHQDQQFEDVRQGQLHMHVHPIPTRKFGRYLQTYCSGWVQALSISSACCWNAGRRLSVSPLWKWNNSRGSKLAACVFLLLSEWSYTRLFKVLFVGGETQ